MERPETEEAVLASNWRPLKSKQKEAYNESKNFLLVA